MESGEQTSKETVSGPSVSPPNSLNSATATPKEKRDNKRTRTAAAFTPEEKESKQHRKLDINLDDSESDPDVEPETKVPVIKQAPTMSDLKDKPTGFKPYRAYQEHAASREKAKFEKCAIYE